MRELSPLGGHHSFATGVNGQGQIVGWGETAEPESTCVDKQVLGFRAAIWELKPGSKAKIKARELPPWPGDAASAATAINDAGQAVGISGRCDQGWDASARSARFGGTGTASPTPSRPWAASPGTLRWTSTSMVT